MDPQPTEVASQSVSKLAEGRVQVERLVLKTQRGMLLPITLLIPKDQSPSLPLVVAVSQAGSAGFLKQRSGELAELFGPALSERTGVEASAN